MALKLVTAPSIDPITGTDAKTRLRISGTADDSLIADLITASRIACEEYTGLSLINTTWKLVLDCWPTKNGRDKWWDGVVQGPMSMIYEGAREIPLPRAPLASVTSFVVYDTTDTAGTIGTSVYQAAGVGYDRTPGRVVLRYGQVWPATVLRPAEAIEINYVAGYGSVASSVPMAIRQGLFEHVAFLYENRGEMLGPDGKLADIPPIPPQTLARYNQFRIIRL
jgi:uncharacterized phiE125 gp8 family phage protein